MVKLASRNGEERLAEGLRKDRADRCTAGRSWKGVSVRQGHRSFGDPLEQTAVQTQLLRYTSERQTEACVQIQLATWGDLLLDGKSTYEAADHE